MTLTCLVRCHRECIGLAEYMGLICKGIDPRPLNRSVLGPTHVSTSFRYDDRPLSHVLCHMSLKHGALGTLHLELRAPSFGSRLGYATTYRIYAEQFLDQRARPIDSSYFQL
jgi:hypothetical protein